MFAMFTILTMDSNNIEMSKLYVHQLSISVVHFYLLMVIAFTSFCYTHFVIVSLLQASVVFSCFLPSLVLSLVVFRIITQTLSSPTIHIMCKR